METLTYYNALMVIKQCQLSELFGNKREYQMQDFDSIACEHEMEMIELEIREITDDIFDIKLAIGTLHMKNFSFDPMEIDT